MNYEDKARSEQLVLDVRDIQEEEPVHALRDEVRSLAHWLNEIQEAGAFLYVKRLSANDTGATDSHQVGIYVPDSVTKAAIPSISHTISQNPDYVLPCKIDSHGGVEGDVRAIYYNNKYFGKTRDEARLTRWAWPGFSSPMKDQDSTGALAVFAFIVEPGKDASLLRLWVCRSPGEEEFVEQGFGEILPGESLVGRANNLRGGAVFSREAEPDISIPPAWNEKFPTGREILDYIFSISSLASLSPDQRLMKRRELEYEVFRKVELVHVMPLIESGFGNVDDFIAIANSVANRRKSRSGHSLELHLRKVFDEEGLPTVGDQCITENNKKPDFLFPCCSAYKDEMFPRERLRMLGVKTTCKDRWRQILSEAAKIQIKHLFTLQEGVSVNQHDEMRDAGVVLVVPKDIHRKYPKTVRDNLMTLEDFLIDTKASSY